jgi:hypothetical protein
VGLHSYEQAPPTHRGTVFAAVAEQMIPQPLQLLMSLVVSTQEPLHGVWVLTVHVAPHP